MDIFERLRSGADVDMATPESAEAIKHMTDCANICFRINTTAPQPEQIRPLEEQLFGGNLDQTSYLMPPLSMQNPCSVSCLVRKTICRYFASVRNMACPPITPMHFR